MMSERDDDDDDDNNNDEDFGNIEEANKLLEAQCFQHSIIACDSWLDTVLVSLELCLNMQLRSTRVIAVCLHRLILIVSKMSILRRKELR